MITRVLNSYPARFVFLLTAIAVAIALISFRLLFIRDSELLRPNFTPFNHIHP